MDAINVGIVSHSPIFAEGIRAILERENTTRVILLPSEPNDWPPLSAVVIESDNLHQIESALMVCRLSNSRVKTAVFLSPLALHLSESIMKLGVDILWDKTQGCEQLDRLFRSILACECVIISQSFWQTIFHDPISSPHYAQGLTEREYQVLSLLDQNYSNTEIAEILLISVHTVKRHVEHLLRKLNATDRHHCVQIAHQMGLLHKIRATLPA